MKVGHDNGRLVLLQNLDPEYTSGDVEVRLPHFINVLSTFEALIDFTLWHVLISCVRVRYSPLFFALFRT